MKCDDKEKFFLTFAKQQVQGTVLRVREPFPSFIFLSRDRVFCLVMKLLKWIILLGYYF